MVAPQLPSQRLRPLCLRRPSQRRRPLLRRLLHQLLLQRRRRRLRRRLHPRPRRSHLHCCQVFRSRLPALWIHLIVPSAHRSHGLRTRIIGVVVSTTGAAPGVRRHLQPRPIHSIVQTALPTGRWDGLCPRKYGAVACMAKVAQAVAAAVRPRHCPTTAQLDSGIGCTAGPLPRNYGAARKKVKDAWPHQVAAFNHPGVKYLGLSGVARAARTWHSKAFSNF